MTRNWKKTLSKRTKKLIKAAEKQGWKVDTTSNSHIRFRHPGGQAVIGDGCKHEIDAHYSKTVKRLKELGLDLDD